MGQLVSRRALLLTVHPPWWNTWWAYLGYAFLFGLSILGANRINRRRIIARERIRAEREKAKAIESTNNELKKALTHLTETQSQLVHAEKMASLGQLTAGIAHELKNPLNFVNNFGLVAKEQAEDIKALLSPENERLNDQQSNELHAIINRINRNHPEDYGTWPTCRRDYSNNARSLTAR